ncbi:MAG: RagB/SusD family nutrient uptake outer membrane protein [Chitinophagaceae bacterium]|nr:RagB/SusD family nutrient uptake outer membrane protein [Chitinophagaceae bacterium]
MMKKSINKYISPLILASALLISSCNKLVDLKPINEISDADYWKTADQFKLAANAFYNYQRSFADILNDNPHADIRADLIITRDGNNLFSSGQNTIPLTDNNWNTAYSRIREMNYLISKAAEYPNPADIALYVAEAKFFRAYIYFDLLQQFGGVPLVTIPLSVGSEELQAPRNTRDEIADFIVKELEEVIEVLPLESNIAAANKGRVSKGAAQSFLARVALYEGTWQKFRNNGSRASTLLDKAISNSDAVIGSGQYQLFAPAALGDSAQKYMFILEDEKSNPAGIGKSANKEYILANRYSFTQRQIRMNVTHSCLNNVFWGSKKMMDMYLCQDGLPVTVSPLFQGYATTRSEYNNRDNRMQYTWMIDGNYYWDNENPGSRVTWVGDAADIANSRGVHNGASNSGYGPQKWCTERRLNDNEEAYDYPVIRYAEVLLTYAEAVFEKNEMISDADLDKSLNLVRNRVNTTMPKLSNALVKDNGLDMRTEIRRERNIELFFEGFRLDDLKRWKTAETEMPQDINGITWTGTQWETRWPGISSQVVNGLLRLQTGRTWADKNYLLPIPTQQISLNNSLEQNPGWQ